MGTVLAMVVALMAPNSQAIFEFDVSPSDAKVYIDDKPAKLVKGRVAVTPGKRQIKVTRSGYRSAGKSVAATKGKVTRIVFKLSKTSSKAPAKKPVAKAPAKKPPAKKPVAKRPAKKPMKKPVAKAPAKKPMKKPTRRPVKKPVAKSPSKRPVKKPVKRPSKKPKVAKRPVKRPAKRPGARPSGTAAPVRDTREPSRPSYRGYAVVSLLIGAAATTGGVIVGMQADEKADEFNRSTDRFDKQELKDDTEFRATASNVLYGVGAAGVVIGALLWAAEPDYRATVSPMPGGGTYVGFEGRF